MIAIIDYEAGNLKSVSRALEYLGERHRVTRDAGEILNADRVIFPGVGAAASAMGSLRRFGLDDVLKKVLQSKKPLLGICLGTQIITSFSEEGNTECLGLLPGSVKAFSKEMRDDEDGRFLKIPHMGWNRVEVKRPHPVLAGLQAEDFFYFVHSFYPVPENPDHVLAETPYGIRFTSAMGFENLVATQFHPEKSGEPGLRLFKNFCKWEGIP